MSTDTGGGASRFVLLSERYCLEHLRSARLGHLAASIRALPVVVPVRLEPIRLEPAAAVLGIEPPDAMLGVDPVLGAVMQLSTDSIVALVVGGAGEGARSEWFVLAQGVLSARPPPGAEAGRQDVVAGDPISRFLLRCAVLTGWQRSTCATRAGSLGGHERP